MEITEIIPLNPLPLPGIETALTTMDKLENSLAPLAERAQTLQVIDAASFAEAGELIAQLKSITKESEVTLAPFKLIVQRVKDFMQTRFNRNSNRATEIHGVLSRKMGDYTRQERPAAHKEEDKTNRQREKQGLPPVNVQPNIPKVAGVRNTVNFPITIEDPKALIKACLKAYKATDTKRFQFLAQFIKLDETTLAAHARDLKDAEKFNSEVPGVKCEKKEAFGGKV